MAGQKISLDGTKQKTILVAFLLRHGQPIQDSRFIELLWGVEPPRTVTAQLCTYVSRLRQRLGAGSEFVRMCNGYMMSAYDAWFDYEEFQRLSLLGSAELSERRYSLAADHYRNALELWRGPALEDVTEFLESEEAYSFAESRLTALEGRLEADLRLGRNAQITPELFQLVRRYPLRERFRAQLMQALYRNGRQVEALRVYHEGRQILAQELGIDPDITVQNIFRAILEGDSTLR